MRATLNLRILLALSVVACEPKAESEPTPAPDVPAQAVIPHVDFIAISSEVPVLNQVTAGATLVGSGDDGLWTSDDGVLWVKLADHGLSSPTLGSQGVVTGIYGQREGNANAMELHQIGVEGETTLFGLWSSPDLLQPMHGGGTLYVYVLEAGVYQLYALQPEGWLSVPVPATEWLVFAGNDDGLYAADSTTVYRVDEQGLVPLHVQESVAVIRGSGTTIAVYGRGDDGLDIRTTETEFASSTVRWSGETGPADLALSPEGSLFLVDFDQSAQRIDSTGMVQPLGRMPAGPHDLAPLGERLFARVGFLWGEQTPEGLRVALPANPKIRYGEGEHFRERRIFALTYRPETTFDASQVVYTDDSEQFFAGAVSAIAPIENAFCGGANGFFIGARLGGGKAWYSEDLLTSLSDGEIDFQLASIDVPNEWDWAVHDCVWRGNGALLVAGEDNQGGLFTQGSRGAASWGHHATPWVRDVPTAMDRVENSDLVQIATVSEDSGGTLEFLADGFPSPTFNEHGLGRSFARVVSMSQGMYLWDDAVITSYYYQGEPLIWTHTGLPQTPWLHLQAGTADQDGHVWIGTVGGLYRSLDPVNAQ